MLPGHRPFEEPKWETQPTGRDSMIRKITSSSGAVHEMRNMGPGEALITRRKAQEGNPQVENSLSIILSISLSIKISTVYQFRPTADNMG